LVDVDLPDQLCFMNYWFNKVYYVSSIKSKFPHKSSQNIHRQNSHRN
jgi:hypothetical protein